MTKPEEKKAIPESDNPTDRRIQLGRRFGRIGRRIQRSDNPTTLQIQPDERRVGADRRILPDQRRGRTDRRILPDRRHTITDSITDYRKREFEGVKAKRKWYKKIITFIFGAKKQSHK